MVLDCSNCSKLYNCSIFQSVTCPVDNNQLFKVYLLYKKEEKGRGGSGWVP